MGVICVLMSMTQVKKGRNQDAEDKKNIDLDRKADLLLESRSNSVPGEPNSWEK